MKAPEAPPPQSPYMSTVCPRVTSFLMSMSIYIMTLQHVWYIWQVCEVMVFSYTVVVVEMQTDREEERKCFFFFSFALTANKLLCCSVVTSPSTELRLCEPLTSDLHSNTGKKKQHLTNTLSVILGFWRPLLHFISFMFLLCSPTLPFNFPDSDWWSTVL